jgi:hypothetical protein
MELSKGEYALVIVMLAKHDIFGNWTKHHMCGDYRLGNKQTCLNKYAMQLPEQIFYACMDMSMFLILWMYILVIINSH